MLLGGPLGPWQALLMSPKGRNASRDGFENLNISLNSIASFGSLAPVGLALLFCFSLIRRPLSFATTWNQQYIYTYRYEGHSKIRQFFNFLLISIHNEFILQHNLRHGRCASPGGAFIHFYHF